MKASLVITIVCSFVALAVPLAAAAPDGYQPQLRQQSDGSDVIDRYLRSHIPEQSDGSDVIDRYLRSQSPVSSAAQHPDSLRLRPVSTALPNEGVAATGYAWAEFATGLAGGLVATILVAAGVLVARGRSRLAPS
jgi:hypothetical protein